MQLLRCKYVELFLSLFSSKYQNGVKGSTVDQRLSQLNAVYHLMKMSPIGGLGERFGDYISNQYTSAALEYESIWFDVMAKHFFKFYNDDLFNYYYS